MSHESSHLATRCVHAGELDDPHGSPHTPLYHSTTFKFASTADIVDVVQGRRSAALYTRYGLNPTIRSLEDKLAALEGAQAALAFCSGMAAESALFLTHGRKGIVCLGDAYGGTLELLASQLPQLGIPTHLLLSHELGRLDEILAKGVGLVFFETPTNPGLEIFDIHAVAKEINGYFLEDVYDTKVEPPKLIGKKGDLVTSFPSLQADGTTSSGCWIYCNSYILKDGKEVNMMARRGKKDPTGLGLYPEWTWSWPVNRRIIYNRASVDLNGQPWDPKRPLLKFNATKLDAKTGKPGVWEGDVVDGGGGPAGSPTGKLPFIMKPDGIASIFGSGMAEGPFPEHYEAMECPLEVNPMSKQRVNPTIKIFGDKMDASFSCDARFPFVCTTYRVSEHWQTGVMTRHCSWLLEMQPQNFVEMSVELAKELKINNGETVIVSSGRGEIQTVAMVSERFKPFKIAGSTVHQVGIPWHFGWQFPEDGSGYDSVNLLTPNVGDANTMIPESKAFMVNVRKA